MNTVLETDGEEIGQGFEWLLCECPVCTHDDVRLCKFLPEQPKNSGPIYFAVCACCKNSTENCKTVYEAVQKWDELCKDQWSS